MHVELYSNIRYFQFTDGKGLQPKCLVHNELRWGNFDIYNGLRQKLAKTQKAQEGQMLVIELSDPRMNL